MIVKATCSKCGATVVMAAEEAVKWTCPNCRPPKLAKEVRPGVHPEREVKK